MEQTAIKVEHVSKDFKLPHEKTTTIKSAVVNFWRRNSGYEIQKALDDVSFEIKKGEFFGIVGRNGSGKSTLLKLLAGIYAPTKGQVHVNGSLTPFIELGVGFNPELTGRENVYLNGALLGFNRKEMRAMYKDIVKFAELEKFMDQKLKNYSSGMQVRLAFSISIQVQSDILVLDEVLAVGDAAFQKKCVDYFKELKQSGRTVVLVSHDMKTVEKYCDRVILIHNGKLVEEGDAATIAAEYQLINLEGAAAPQPADSGNLGRQASIDGVTINGKKDAVLDEGGRLEVDIRFTAKKSLTALAGISIIRDDGVFMAYSNTLKDPGARHCQKGKHGFTVSAGLGDFVPGTYLVDAALYDEDENYLDRQPGAARFVLKGQDDSEGGAIKLKTDWRLH